MAKKLTSKKAREILHDKSVHGKPLTDKQRRFFGAISSGKSNWLKKYQDAGETLPPYPVPRSSYMPNPYSNEFYKKRMDESLASSQDFLRKWYEGRKTLPEFKDVSERRLKLLDRPINIEYEDYETQKQKSSAAAYNPNDQTLILTDLSKPYNPGYPAYQDLDDYNYKVSTSTGAPVMVHEVAHKLQYEAPQQGYRSYMPPGPLIPSRKEFASPKNSGLDKDQYRYLSSRDVALSKRLNRSAPFPADKASVFHPELESGVAMLRMAENMDPTKKYTAEDLIPIINKYAQEPTEEKETPYTPEEATQEHNKWFINDMFRLFGNDPEKIAKYINSVARNERKPSNTAKHGGWLKKHQSGGDISLPNVYPNAMVPKLQYGSVIEDDMGQWKYPGQVTRINSNQITMQGVPYPVLGISDTGDKQMMYPNQEYKFKGKSVTEYPMMQKGGLKKSYNPNLASKDVGFQNWYKQNTLEGQRGIPYGKNLDYDYYSFYRNEDYKNPRFSVENHFPDTYKRPNHETFSNESIYSTPENPGGSWDGERYNPKGRWLNKYQSAGTTAKDQPKKRYDWEVEIPTPASESTSIVYYTREGPKSTATTGNTKEQMKSSSAAMYRARQSKKQQEKKRIAERDAATATRENPNVPFTLPTGESKKWDDMDWREKSYVTGKNMENVFRFFPGEESFIDEWLNPFNMTFGSMGSGLAAAPYVAQKTDSYTPYALGIGLPVVAGALPGITKGLMSKVTKKGMAPATAAANPVINKTEKKIIQKLPTEEEKILATTQYGKQQVPNKLDFVTSDEWANELSFADIFAKELKEVNKNLGRNSGNWQRALDKTKELLQSSSQNETGLRGLDWSWYTNPQKTFDRFGRGPLAFDPNSSAFRATFMQSPKSLSSQAKHVLFKDAIIKPWHVGEKTVTPRGDAAMLFIPEQKGGIDLFAAPLKPGVDMSSVTKGMLNVRPEFNPKIDWSSKALEQYRKEIPMVMEKLQLKPYTGTEAFKQLRPNKYGGWLKKYK